VSERGFGPHGKPLADLSDEELRAELGLRRQRRGARGKTAAPAATTSLTRGDDASSTLAAPIAARHYASLELVPGAPLPEVERAYERLRAKYEPFTRVPDAERSSAAASLLRGLQRAYEELRAALERR
jgi:hypothetical protein